MEHVITPAIEEELTYILDNPRKDPHNKPIPPYEVPFLLGGPAK
jgi:manganese/zinc/iron transport system permease protein